MLSSPRPRKKCANVRERNSRPVFSESDMAERKRNSTGREVLPARPLRVAWLCAKRRRGFDTAASNPAPRAQGEATKPAARIAGLKPAFHDDLLYPPFYRLLEFRMLLNSGCLA